jgi:hypothetical protein
VSAASLVSRFGGRPALSAHARSSSSSPARIRAPDGRATRQCSHQQVTERAFARIPMGACVEIELIAEIG